MSKVKALLKAAWGEFLCQIRRSIQMFFLWVGFKVYPDNWDQSLEDVRKEAIEGILSLSEQAVQDRINDLNHVFLVTLRKPYAEWKTDQRFLSLLTEVNKCRALKKQREITLP